MSSEDIDTIEKLVSKCNLAIDRSQSEINILQLKISVHASMIRDLNKIQAANHKKYENATKDMDTYDTADEAIDAICDADEDD